MSTQLVIKGDSLQELGKYPDNYFGAVITDPPYGLGKEPNPYVVLKDWVECGYSEVSGKGFMNKEWDSFVPQPIVWKEVLRVLKPGGHALVFCGTRTQDWMAMSLRFAGFEIKDIVTWLHAQGFPKSLNIGKALDKKLGNEREIISSYKVPDIRGDAYGTVNPKQGGSYNKIEVFNTVGNTEWEGWGTALKPACEFITLARKPISENSIIENVLRWGVGAINIDATRVALDGEIVPVNILEEWSGFGQKEKPDYTPIQNTKGRFPANLILDENAGKLLDEQTGILKSGKMRQHIEGGQFTVFGKQYPRDVETIGDFGGASRFFYCAKPSKKEKDRGLEVLEDVESGVGALRDGGRGKTSKNFHPTVKPVELIKYLVKLITPPNEQVLDPFLGSGTTLIACKELEIDAVGIERDGEYAELSKTRIQNW